MFDNSSIPEITRVIIEEKAFEELVRCVKSGFSPSHQREVLGFLLGEIKRGICHIKTVVAYRGGKSTEKGIDFDETRLIHRATELERLYRLEYLGLFHSHIPLGDKTLAVFSYVDRYNMYHDENSIVEILVALLKEGQPLKGISSKGRILAHQENLTFLISCYIKKRSPMGKKYVKLCSLGVQINHQSRSIPAL